MGLGQEYAQAVHDEAAWWGTYPPNLPIRVGDFVEFNTDGSIVPLGSTTLWPGWSALSIESEPMPGTQTFTHLGTRTLKLAAATGTDAGEAQVAVGVDIGFTRQSGFALDYISQSWHHYADADTARRWVLELAKKGIWPEERALITDVIETASATVAASRQAGASVGINFGVKLPSTATFNLADTSLNVGADVTNGSTLLSITTTPSTPLYRCVRVSKSWLHGWTAKLLTADGIVDLVAAFDDSPFDADV